MTGGEGRSVERAGPGHGRVWLLLLLAAPLALRLAGANHMLPHLAEPDAHVVDQVELFRTASEEARRESKAWAKYPHLLSRLLALWPADEPPGEPVTSASLEERLVAVGAPLRRGRILVALLSTALVPATWLLGRRLVSGRAALAAAFLVGFSLLHLNLSWQARPHGPLATFTTLGLVALLRLVRRPTTGAYLLAGLACALAIACLHNGLALLPAALAAHLLARRSPGERLLRDARWLLPLPLLAGAFLLFYPFLLAGTGGARLELEPGGIYQGGHQVAFAELDGSGFAHLARDLARNDPLLGLLAAAGALVGLVALVRRRPPRAPQAPGPTATRARELAVVAAFALPYLLALGAFRETYERFQVPLVPVYALLAAWLLDRLGSLRSPRVAGALLTAVVLVQAIPAARLAWLCRAPDTGRLVARWMDAELEPGAARILVRPGTSLPILRDPTSLPPPVDADSDRRQPWQRHLRHLGATGGIAPGEATWDVRTIPFRQMTRARRLRFTGRDDPQARKLVRELIDQLDGDWALIEVEPGSGPLGVVPGVVAGQGRFVRRFSPFDGGTADGTGGGLDDRPRPRLGRGYEDEDLWLRAWRADRWGPAYDLYELP